LNMNFVILDHPRSQLCGSITLSSRTDNDEMIIPSNVETWSLSTSDAGTTWRLWGCEMLFSLFFSCIF